MKLMLACLIVLALVVLPACAQTPAAPETSLPPATTPETQAPTTTPPPTTPAQETTPPAATTEADIEAARQAVFAYREAYNNYDIEGALAFLTESHRAEREESIRSDIGQMKTYGIKLGVEEEAEPTVTADGKVEIYIKLDVPVLGQPDRHATYQLVKLNGEWKICSST